MYELVGKIPGTCRLLTRAAPQGNWLITKLVFDKPYASHGKRRAWFYWQVAERRPSESTAWLRDAHPDVYDWASKAMAVWSETVISN